MADLETLTLQINTESQQAYTAIDKLAQRLNHLSVSMAKLETGKLTTLASGLDNLNMVIANMNATSSKWDYDRIVSNINTLATANISGLDSLSASLGNLTGAITNLSNVTSVTDNVKNLILAIGKLGGKSIDRAIQNIPKLEQALGSLINRFSKFPDINQSVIEFINSLTNLAAQGSKVGNATKSIKGSLESFESSATRATRKSFSLASAIGKVYAQFWIAMRAASGLKKSFMNAADYLEAYNYFDVVAEKIGTDTFRKAGVGSADEYAEAFTSEMRRKLKQMSGLELDLEDRLIKTTNAKSLGLNITEITQYQASIASITNAMGQAQEVSTATAKAFSMLAADMGSLRNVDYEQVAANLQSALTGQARALYKYGIDLTTATLEQYAYANGVEKAVSEMTQAEKAQLRLLAILDQSKVAWGDLANTINSPANQLRQLKTNFSELGTVLGQLFIPIMQRTLPWINGLSIALKQLLIDIASLLGIELNLDEFGKGFSDTIDEDTEAIDELNKSMKETKKGIREFDELKVIGGDKSKAGTGLSDQIDLTNQILDATAEYERVWDEAYRQMESKAQAVADALKGALDPIRKIVEDFHIGNFFKAGEDVSDLAISIFNFISDAIDDVDWKAIGVKIGEFVEGIKWEEVFRSIARLIASAIQGVIDLWKGAFTAAPFETAIISAFAIMKFTGLGTDLKRNLVGIVTGTLKDPGISKAVMGKLGALSLGIGVALTIDNVTSIKAGEYSAISLQSMLKMGVSSLFSGAGISLLAKSIGFASGGLAFGIGVAISLMANLVIGLVSMDTPLEEAKKITDAEYQWITDNNLEAMEIKTNIELRGSITQDSLDNIDDLAKKVWDMSQNYDNLTAVQKGWLKEYSDQLVQAVPSIEGQIDKITGAYKGTYDQLQQLIDKEKEQILLESYRQNLTETQSGINTAKSNLKRIWSDQASNKDLQADLKEQIKQDLEKYGISYSDDLFEDILKRQDDNFYFKLNPIKNQELNEALLVLENTGTLKAYNDAIAKERTLAEKEKETTETLKGLTETREELYTQMNKTFEEVFGEIPDTISEAIDNTVDILKEEKLPKNVKSTMDKVDNQISRGQRVTDANMNKMFNSINNAFYGLPTGEVPSDVKATMDAIKRAIENDSPEIIELMKQLKIQMIEAFENAQLAGNDKVLWNPKGVVTNIDSAFNSIQTALETGAKPGTKSLEKYVGELFGNNLPETVDGSLKALANSIEKGEGKQAILNSIDALKYDIVNEAQKLGMNVDLGIAGGVFNGVGYTEESMSYLVQRGLVDTYKDETETNSPSKLFKRLAVNIPEGIGLGIQDGISYATKAMTALVSDMQSSFKGVTYNIPSLNLGGSNRNQYYSNENRYSNAGASLYEAMNSIYSRDSGQTEVVFRVEGDPYGIFKVVRDENDSYKKMHHRSAFS